jgi:hypothetical protein
MQPPRSSGHEKGPKKAATKRRFGSKMAADPPRHVGKFGLVQAGLGNVSGTLHQTGKIRTGWLPQILCESYPNLLQSVQPSVFCSKVATRAGLLKNA